MRGILKGWDPLVNLVLDEAVEEMRGAFDCSIRCSGLAGNKGAKICECLLIVSVTFAWFLNSYVRLQTHPTRTGRAAKSESWVSWLRVEPRS